MEKDIQKLLDEIEQMEKMKSSLIAEENKHYELYKETKAKIEILENKLEQAKSLTIPVRLGDLLEELTKLTGRPLNEINVQLFFDSWSTNKDNFEIQKEIIPVIGNGIYFTISDNYGEFSYEGITVPHTKEEILELFGHTSGQIKKICGYYLIPIDIDVENITLKLSPSLLQKDRNVTWYPEDTFREAVINCSERKQGISKIRKLDNKD